MVKGTAKSKRSANGKRTASGNGTESDKDTADAKDTANSYVPPLVKALLTEKRKNKGSDLSSEVSCHSDKQGIVGIRCKRFGKYLTIPNNKYIVL